MKNMKVSPQLTVQIPQNMTNEKKNHRPKTTCDALNNEIITMQLLEDSVQDLSYLSTIAPVIRFLKYQRGHNRELRNVQIETSRLLNQMG